MFGSAREGEPFPLSTDPGAPQTMSIYVSVDAADIDKHYAKAKEFGAEIIMDLYDTDYGSLEYKAKDFEGHLWSFGTYLPTRPT